MSEWTDEDDAECEAACKKWTYIDGRIGVLNDRLNYIMAKPAEYSLAEERELRAEIIRLKGELNALKNSGREVQPQRDFTEAQKRQVELIKAVRKRMQEQYDRDDKLNRQQVLRGMKNTGELRRLGYSGNNVLEKCRKHTNPGQVIARGFEADYLKRFD